MSLSSQGFNIRRKDSPQFTKTIILANVPVVWQVDGRWKNIDDCSFCRLPNRAIATSQFIMTFFAWVSFNREFFHDFFREFFLTFARVGGPEGRPARCSRPRSNKKGEKKSPFRPQGLYDANKTAAEMAGQRTKENCRCVRAFLTQRIPLKLKATSAQPRPIVLRLRSFPPASF